MRADVLLVERGLAASRTAAQRLIAAGHVFGREGTLRIAISKPSVSVAEDISLEIEGSELDRFVSRGGLKLEGALNHIALDVKNMRCLDVGQSTGGFTDCLLQRGATYIVGIDVGHDQLHAKIRNHSRVTCIEGLNARTLQNIGEPFDLVVADVSFISLTKVLPQWPALLHQGGCVLSLVKPQFEVGAGNVARGGIVRDESLYVVVEKNIRKACADARLNVLDYFDSSITGGDGNREFFVYAKASP